MRGWLSPSLPLILIDFNNQFVISILINGLQHRITPLKLYNLIHDCIPKVNGFCFILTKGSNRTFMELKLAYRLW